MTAMFPGTPTTVRDRYSIPRTTSSDSMAAGMKDMKIYVIGLSVFANIFNHLRRPLHSSIILPEGYAL
jgi:hypothetical protein